MAYIVMLTLSLSFRDSLKSVLNQLLLNTSLFPEYPEEMFFSHWTTLSERYRNNPWVVGAGLKFTITFCPEKTQRDEEWNKVLRASYQANN